MNEIYNATILNQYSNFDRAQRKAYQLLGHYGDLYVSPRKDKKYRILDPVSKKWIDFGQLPYEDYTYHQDEKRKLAFQKRNHEWADRPVFTPAWLSYWILWT
jgi:hypothetical protein